MMPDDAPAVALRALTLAYPELAATKVDLARTSRTTGAQGAAKIQRLMPPGDWAEAR